MNRALQYTTLCHDVVNPSIMVRRSEEPTTFTGASVAASLDRVGLNARKLQTIE
jgi:hypothetical protein